MTYNVTRIMCVGAGRLWESMVSLSFDHNLMVKPDKTYIFSPHTQSQFMDAFDEFGISGGNIEIFDDSYFDEQYNNSEWKHDNWYRQQVLKLCSLDYFDSEYFLIQDADIVLLKPYNMFIDGKINFKAEKIWHEYHQIYEHMVEQIIGQTRVLDYSFVSELMPYAKKDWLAIKARIGDWINTIPKVRAFDNSKWFSEYELLGIFKTNLDSNWTYEVTLNQSPITTWDEFYAVDWNNFTSVKFHVRPFKQMNVDQAKMMIKHLKDNYVTVN